MRFMPRPLDGSAGARRLGVIRMVYTGRRPTGGTENPSEPGADTAIADKTVLVTGASRGIGRALVTDALAQGAARVYAGTHQLLEHPHRRVTPLIPVITSPGKVREAARQVQSLHILVNNADVFLYDDASDRAAFERHLAVNFYGTYDVTRAFLPALTRYRELSPASGRSRRWPDPAHPGLLGLEGGCVQPCPGAAHPAGRAGGAGARRPRRPGRYRYGPGSGRPKSSPESVARVIFDGIEGGEEEILPDPFSQALAACWRTVSPRHSNARTRRSWTQRQSPSKHWEG
jgi:hypothetical protein